MVMNNEAEEYQPGDLAVYAEADMRLKVRVIENNSTDDENIFTLEVIETIAPRGSDEDQTIVQIMPPISKGKLLHPNKPRLDEEIHNTWELLPSFTFGS